MFQLTYVESLQSGQGKTFLEICFRELRQGESISAKMLDNFCSSSYCDTVDGQNPALHG